MASNYYNNFNGYGKLSYNIISYLIENNEDIWKMIKYATVDALDMPNLSPSEKASLIYSGQVDTSDYRVFRDEFTDDAFEEQVCQLRIFPSYTSPVNRVVSIQDITFQIVCHVKINYMNDYIMRMDNMIEEVIKTLNGKDVGGLGVIFLDKERSRSSSIYRGANLSNNRNFLGANIVMCLNSAG